MLPQFPSQPAGLLRFQIPQEWLDRTLDMHSYMVATIDSATGTRGPAQVYADHALKTSMKGLYLDAATRSKDKLAYARNVSGYPGKNVDPGKAVVLPGPPPRKTGATQPSPVRVTIPDADQGREDNITAAASAKTNKLIPRFDSISLIPSKNRY